MTARLAKFKIGVQRSARSWSQMAPTAAWSGPPGPPEARHTCQGPHRDGGPRWASLGATARRLSGVAFQTGMVVVNPVGLSQRIAPGKFRTKGLGLAGKRVHTYILPLLGHFGEIFSMIGPGEPFAVLGTRYGVRRVTFSCGDTDIRVYGGPARMESY